MSSAQPGRLPVERETDGFETRGTPGSFIQFGLERAFKFVVRLASSVLPVWDMVLAAAVSFLV